MKDETAYWLELLVDAELIRKEKLGDLLKETEEPIAIFVIMVKKVKARK